MSREIEANFTTEWGNEENQCQRCDSFKMENGVCVCTEDGSEITPESHCDFFRSID